MSKRILTTIAWVVCYFIFFAAIEYYSGADDWLKETIHFVLPSLTGYFIGRKYGQNERL